MKKKILWLSLSAPYDKVKHAGGKVHNYYLKKMISSNFFDFRIISFCYENEKEDIDLNKYRIRGKIFIIKENIISTFLKKIYNVESTLSIFNKYAGIVPNYQKHFAVKELHRLKKIYEPQVIVVQWTQMVVLMPIIKECFPKAKIISIEEDVSFLGYERRNTNASNFIAKFFWKTRYHQLKKIELEALSKSDIIITNNEKDYNILIQNKIDIKKLYTWCPYFTKFLSLQHNCISKDILYYGAMFRPENYLSAIWFIENVFWNLEDKETRFVVVGANPNNRLKKYESNRIIIKDFVPNLDDVFTDCLCMVAPLILGAGVKIKILEALSAGIPILTNDIGIEGIYITDKLHYLHCSETKDYILFINELLKNQINTDEMSYNAKKFIAENYDENKSAGEFYNILKHLAESV